MSCDWKFWIKRKYIKHYNKTGNQKNVWIVIEKLEKGMDYDWKIWKGV